VRIATQARQRELTRALISIERLLLLDALVSEGLFIGFTTAGITVVGLTLLIQAALKWLELKGSLMKAKFKMRLVAERYKEKDVASLRKSLLSSAMRQKYGGERSPLILLRSLLLCFVCFLIPILMETAVADLSDELQAELTASPAGHPVVQVLLCILGTGFGVHLVLCLSEWGRKRLEDLAALVNSIFVGLFLFVLSLLYTPITKYLISVFECISLTCVSNEWYPRYASDAQYTLEAVAGGACTPCQFYEYTAAGASFVGSTCPAFDACPGERVSVLKADNTLDCPTQVRPFYWPASFLMLTGFTFAVMYLYWSLVAHHTRILKAVPVDTSKLPQIESNEAGRSRCSWLARLLLCHAARKPHLIEDNFMWDYRVLRSRNRAKTLYVHFEYRWRFFRLAHIVQKLLLVLIVVFFSSSTVFAALALVVINGVMLFLALTQKPYFSPVSNAINFAATLACFVNPVFLLLTYYHFFDEMSVSAAAAILIFFNYGVPALCLILGLVLAFRHASMVQQQCTELEEAMDPEELIRTATKRKQVDRELDKDTLSSIASTFMVMAFTAFMAMFLLLLGNVYTSAEGVVVQATPASLGSALVETQGLATCEVEERLAQIEFLYYPSWAAFVAACCCSDQSWNSTDSGQVEQWSCPDLSPQATAAASVPSILYKQRVRKTIGEGGDVTDGFRMRPFCAPTFNDGFLDPEYDESMLAFVVRASNGSLAPNWQRW